MPHKPNIFKNSVVKGYLDYKYTQFGNNASGPVVFRVNVTQAGYVSKCIW